MDMIMVWLNKHHAVMKRIRRQAELRHDKKIKALAIISRWSLFHHVFDCATEFVDGDDGTHTPSEYTSGLHEPE